MEITPEQRQQIYEEEKARLAGQEAVPAVAAPVNAPLAPRTAGTPILMGLAGAFGMVLAMGAFLLGLRACVAVGDQSPAVYGRSGDLKATVGVRGALVSISNGSEFDWDGCTAELNDGFAANVGTLAPGQTTRISTYAFTKEDGTRFSILRTKPIALFLACKVNGEQGSYYAKWD